jgi:putative ABC transport system ATP-binding protein
MSQDTGLLVDARGLSKRFPSGEAHIDAIREVDLQIRPGEFLAIMGPSGSGKSTLLHIIGALERPTSGEYLFSGRDVFSLDDSELSLLRARRLGFVFQTFNLIRQLNVLENVEVPLSYQGIAHRTARRQALEAVERVGLAPRAHHRPFQLSGGELQRAAIARALAVRPLLILADEPTGNLDSATGGQILELFLELNRRGSTILLVTHDNRIAALASRKMCLCDGILAKYQER